LTGSLSVNLQVILLPLKIIDDSFGNSPPVPPNGTVGVPYQAFFLSGAGGTQQGYQWTITGSLPPGITAGPPAGCTPPGCALEFSGTPTSAGNTQISLQLNDSGGNKVSTPLAFVINPAPPQPVAPTADSVTPASGAGTSQSFTFKYSSVNAYAYLKTMYGMIDSTLSNTSSCSLEYQQSGNRLYLYNDAGTALLGPVTPGVAGTLSNSQCSVNAGATSVSGSGNTLSLKVAVSFTPAFAGLKNVYGYALDNGNLYSGWKTLGTWNTALQSVAPTADSVTPAGGAGTSQSFTFKYSSVNTYGYLKTLYGLIDTTLSNASSCSLEYQQSSNLLYLYNDAGSALLGPVTPGGAGTLSNNQCTLNAGASSVSGSGNTLTLKAALSFAAAFGGLRNVYGYALDNGNLNSGWKTLGIWNAAAPLVVAPTADSVTPAGGAGTSQSFTFKYSSVNTYGYLKTMYGLINTTLSNASSCSLEYQQSSNQLYLYNDAGSALLGPMTPGVAGTLSDSQCTVNAGASTVSGSGNTLSLKVAVSFTPAFAGLKNVYGYALDNGNLNSGWKTMGIWNTGPQSIPPTADSVTPAGGAGTSQSFTFKYSSVNTYGYLNTMYGLINTTLSNTSACSMQYRQAGNLLYLYNDAGTALLGPMTLGVAGTLSNSQCTLDAGASSVSGSGNTLSLKAAVSFTPAFAGLKNVYGYANDNGNLYSGWKTLGTWNTAAP
jgi:hypothetical protein